MQKAQPLDARPAPAEPTHIRRDGTPRMRLRPRTFGALLSSVGAPNPRATAKRPPGEPSSPESAHVGGRLGVGDLVTNEGPLTRRPRDGIDKASPDTAPFAPPPAILAPPVGAADSSIAGSAAAHAQTAALVERLVTSLRVGRVGERGREVRMRLSLGPQADVDVRLCWEHGRLSAVLEAPPHTIPEARRIADLFERALSERDIDVARVRVRTAR